MKKFFLYALLALFALPAAAADWWLMPTICKPDQTLCYPGATGAGFDANEWDVGGNCRGKKLVCPNAILPPGSGMGPTLYSMSEITDATKINADFDMSALDTANGCFGLRKTKNNGTNAKVGSEWRNVYCNGVLDDEDEILPTGKIMWAAADQPTCATLKDIGFIGILNGSCYGVFKYPAADFYLECTGTDLLPSRIVVLNGASPYVSTAANPTPSAYPTDGDVIAAMFDRMTANAAEQQRAHATRE
jgi:hypothetical protein